VSITTIANRYGRALVDVALAKGQQAQIQQELQAFDNMFKSSPELREVFANPTISQHHHRALLDALIARTKPSEITSNFLHVLVDNYRMQFLSEIYQAFARILDQHLNIVSAEIITAAPISKDQADLLTNQLRKVTGKEVRLKFSTDPAIIGGVVTHIGSEIYDGSIRNQLEQLRAQLSRE
jgi:F-type H+-transporting ATPase subunit delta